MNVTLNTQRLATELRLLNKVVPNKPAIPILSHVLIAAENDSVRLYATDLEVALGSSLDAPGCEDGVVAVPAAKLLAMIEQLPDADVNLSVDKNQVQVRCGAFKAKLQTMRADEFPPPKEVAGVGCAMQSVTLSWLFGKARHATATSSTRHVLHGALLKVGGGVAAIVATDSHRLVVATAGCEAADVNFEIIVPAKTMDILSILFGAGAVTLTKGHQHLFFEIGSRTLTSRAIDGQFPAYERIVPRSNDKVVVLDRAATMAALRRVVLAAEENNAVWMNLAPGADGAPSTLGLSAASAGIGSAEELLPVAYDGPALRVCINGAYVLDFLEVGQEPTVTMMLKDARTAALLQDGRDCFAVIMLMSFL